MDEIEISKARLNESFGSVIVIDNLPIVDKDKFRKLEVLIQQWCTDCGEIVEFYIAATSTGGTQGQAFVEYKNVADALRALKFFENKRMDAKHTLRANLWDDFQKYEALPDEYVPPQRASFESKGSIDLTSWQLDEKGRDQFVVRSGVETEIYWNDPYRMAKFEGRQKEYDGEETKGEGKNWTDMFVAWSTQGKYLATFHQKGIMLWGGAQFANLLRLAHNDVTHINFSPNDKYLVTSNSLARKEDLNCFQFWDVRSGNMLRAFEKGPSAAWPAFRWSFDDKYVARAFENDEGLIKVFEVPSMVLLDKKSFKVAGVKDLQWSPSQNVLAYWVPERPENQNTPAKVALLEIPSRKIIREKHLFNVLDIKLHWQAAGDYLSVKIERKKTKKTVVHSFEIFHLRKKDIPVEVVEFEDNIVDFAWEPVGSRFAIIHGSQGKGSALSMSVYTLESKLELVKTMPDCVATRIFWSPAGENLVLAAIGDGVEKEGQLTFINTSNFLMVCATHHGCNDIEWDPSGRFVITSVCQSFQTRGSVDTNYKLWNSAGQILATVADEKCYQVLWRPRPKALFTPEQENKIRADLNPKSKYWKKFEAEDDEIQKSQLSGAAKDRADWKTQWKELRSQCDEIFKAQKTERVRLRGGYDWDDEANIIEMEIITEEEISFETTSSKSQAHAAS